MIGLPALQSVPEKVAAWAAANPEFAALLNGGIPVEQALARWGLLLLKQNRAAEAASVFRCSLALRADDPILWTNCGLALDQSNSLAEAAVCFEQSLAMSPHQADTWLLLGLSRKKQGDLPAAEAAYREALRIDPASSVAWQCLGLLKEEQRQYPAAIECFSTCIRRGGATPALFAGLGKLYDQVGRFTEAHAAFRKAAELDPSSAHYRKMLRKTCFLCDVLKGIAIDDCVTAYHASLSTLETFTEPDQIDLFDKSIATLGGFGHLEAALRLGRRRLERWPGSATTEYLLQAMAGDARLDRSPPRFIIEQFDASAESFDSRLVNDLGYDIPGKLIAAVRAATPAGHLYDALDAGCGTGLCGPLLHPFARTLAGVDLAPKMIEQAAKRGVYGELVCEDLTVFLRRSAARFDLVVATDVLIYFGDLLPVFASAAIAIRPGGILAVSTESGTESGYRLLASGRFAHAADYVRAAAEEHFTQELCSETTIRLEATQRLAGNLFLFRRRLKVPVARLGKKRGLAGRKARDSLDTC